MLSVDSALVQIWVNSVKSGAIKKEQIPDIANLKELVLSLLEE